MTQQTAEQRERRTIVRAGLFVTLGLALLAVVVVLIGKANNIFGRQVSYHMYFENVEGLKTDSPVWLGGLEVGRVTSISFLSDVEDRRIDVKVEIAKDYSSRVRTDSVARISGRGVLGDKAIDISLGSGKADPIPSGGEISSGSSGDLTTLLKKGGEFVDNAVVISQDLRRAVGAYADPALKDDIAATLASLRSVLGRVEKGPGAVHALLYDKQTAEDTRALVARLSSVAARVDRGSRGGRAGHPPARRPHQPGRGDPPARLRGCQEPVRQPGRGGGRSESDHRHHPEWGGDPGRAGQRPLGLRRPAHHPRKSQAQPHPP